MSLELLLAPVTEYNTVSKPHSLKDPRFIQEQLYSPNEDATLVKPKKYNTDARVINRLPVYQSVFKPKRTTDTNAFRTAFREQFALKQETLTFNGWSEIDKFRWLINATPRQLESVRPENYFGVRLYTHNDGTLAIIDFDIRMVNKAQLRPDGFYLINAGESPLPFDDPEFIDLFKSVKNIWLDRKTYKPISRSYIIRESTETQQLTSLNDKFENLKNEYAKILQQNYKLTYGNKPAPPSNYDEVYKAFKYAISEMTVKNVNVNSLYSTTAMDIIKAMNCESNIRHIAMSIFLNTCLEKKINKSLATAMKNESITDEEIEKISEVIKKADDKFGEALDKGIDKMSTEEYKDCINTNYNHLITEFTKSRNKLTREGNWTIVSPNTFKSNYKTILDKMVEDFEKNKQSKAEEAKAEEIPSEEPEPEKPESEEPKPNPENNEQVE